MYDLFKVDENQTPDYKKMSEGEKYDTFVFGVKSLVHWTGFSLRNIFKGDQMSIKIDELAL